MTNAGIKTVITYGTFDLFHAGHVRMLERARSLGDRLVVGVSTDEFNAEKGKRSIFSYEERSSIVRSIRYVDEVFPEANWSQKEQDITSRNASVFVIGEDWKGKFDHLAHLVDVVYLPRTPSVSTTEIKTSLRGFSVEQVDALRSAVDTVAAIVRGLN